MLSHTTKIILSGSLSLLSVILFMIWGGEQRKKCMFAMILSSAGDLFMTDTFRMGGASLYIGASFFIAAHVVNALCFTKASLDKGYEYKNTGCKAGITLVLVAAAGLTVAMLSVTGTLQSMYFPVLVYFAVIGWNLVSQYSYAFSEMKERLMLMPAMFLFLFSDYLIFISMLNIAQTSDDLVWFTYVPAQLLILLFNSSPGRTENRERAGVK